MRSRTGHTVMHDEAVAVPTKYIVFMDDAESIIAELSSRPQAEMIMNS